MSFLAGRLAATEGAYFLKQSQQAVTRLVIQTNNNNSKNTLPSSSNDEPQQNQEEKADVLHEVLRHSLPRKIIIQPPPSESSLSTSSKWFLHHQSNLSSLSSDARNPLRAYVSLPQVTMGPRRWQLPVGEHTLSASTANALRHDQYVNPEKVKAAAEGLSHIGMAFFTATMIVFGGAVVAFGVTASKLELHSSDDIKTKGRDLIQPKFETIREQLNPLQIWAKKMSTKWHVEKKEAVKDSPLAKELSKRLGFKSSN